MSAKGINGNLLPNQMEIGGRAPVRGRTGRSSGQMVGDTAEGKGGRETPTRLSPTPFEQGSVKDSDTKSQGGATGGGKLSGILSGEGLRGPPPPPSNQNAPRLAAQQAKIRQQAEALALKLRQYKLPSGDLEASVQSMRRLEDALKQKDGGRVCTGRSAARLMPCGRRDKSSESGVEFDATRERTASCPAWMRDEITTGLQDGAPRGVLKRNDRGIFPIIGGAEDRNDHHQDAKSPRSDFHLAGCVFGVLVVTPGALLLGRSIVAEWQFGEGRFHRIRANPLHWDLPDGLGVQWVAAEDHEHGQAIRMDTRLSELGMNEQWTQMGMTNTWFVQKAAKSAIAETIRVVILF